MTGATATRISGLPESYYAPEFLVKVGGIALDPATKGDVLQIRVVLDIKKLASVDMTFNNYDDTRFDLKWSDFKAKGSSSELFALGNPVDVQLGYADELVSMLKGPITSLSAAFPADGAPTLTMRAMDGLVRLKDSRPSQTQVTYRDKQDWEIAQQIAQHHGLRLEADKEGPRHPLIVQRCTDLAFLKERAARIDFDLFMHTDPVTGNDVLHFVKPTDGRDGRPIHTYVLTWGSLRNTATPPSMIEFRPTITTADQVQSVTVRGWDTDTKQPIEHTATPDETPGVSGSGEATGPASATSVAGVEGKKEVVVDAPIASKEEAKHLAESLLAERSYEFLTGSGRTIGLPAMRPGDNVEIHGVGERFGGMYFVTQVTHTLNTSGLLTDFEVRKTYEGARK